MAFIPNIQGSRITGSITNVVSVSSSFTGSLQGTASYATTANGLATPVFPYTGSARITGSLMLTGSFISSNGNSINSNLMTQALILYLATNL